MTVANTLLLHFSLLTKDIASNQLQYRAGAQQIYSKSLNTKGGLLLYGVNI